MHLDRLQNWAQNGPMANDKQSLAMLGLGLLGSAGQAYLGSRANPHQPLGAGAIRKHMRPTQGVIDQMQSGYSNLMNQGQQLMDPNSALNQQQRQMMQDQAANQMAMQHLLARRQAAAMGTDSGITAAQNRGTQAQTARDLYQGHQNALFQNRAQGLGIQGQAQGLLGNIGRMQQGVSENIAQAAIAKRQHQADEWQRRQQAMGDFVGGMGQGAIGMYAEGQNEIPELTDLDMIKQGWDFNAIENYHKWKAEQGQ
tara:strand:+ start:98 stop:862 length:765 start_codon:yes stop_codon:yes gene_type:complete